MHMVPFLCNKNFGVSEKVQCFFFKMHLPVTAALANSEPQPRICRVLGNDQGGFNPLT